MHARGRIVRPSTSGRPTDWTIGELARAAEVTIDTLRYYERRGLLPAPPRGYNNYRRYPRAALELLVFIRRAKGLGLTIRDIEVLIRVRRGVHGATCAEAHDVVRRRTEELKHRLDGLERAARELEDARRRCHGAADPSRCALLSVLA